jgi:hypothetical protein
MNFRSARRLSRNDSVGQASSLSKPSEKPNENESALWCFRLTKRCVLENVSGDRLEAYPTTLRSRVPSHATESFQLGATRHVQTSLSLLRGEGEAFGPFKSFGNAQHWRQL